MTDDVGADEKTKTAIPARDASKDDQTWSTRRGRRQLWARSQHQEELADPVDLEVASREQVAKNASADVGAREFSSFKQAVPIFSGLPDDFPVWSKRFKVFTSMHR